MSTSQATSRPYHHGDLRAALLDAGLDALERSGEADLSLRRLAREVGVSPTAVYRHFPDKDALLAALAAEGVAQLGEAQQLASDTAGGGAAGFAATGRAYVRFALDHPALFRLAFTHAGLGPDPLRGNDAASHLLQAYARQFAGADAEAVALRAWSLAHGLAMLMLDGRVPPDDALIDHVISAGSAITGPGGS